MSTDCFQTNSNDCGGAGAKGYLQENYQEIELNLIVIMAEHAFETWLNDMS